MTSLQPIDGSYFQTLYFWTTTGIAALVAFVGAITMED